MVGVLLKKSFNSFHLHGTFGSSEECYLWKYMFYLFLPWNFSRFYELMCFLYLDVMKWILYVNVFSAFLVNIKYPNNCRYQQYGNTRIKVVSGNHVSAIPQEVKDQLIMLLLEISFLFIYVSCICLFPKIQHFRRWEAFQLFYCISRQSHFLFHFNSGNHFMPKVLSFYPWG